MKLQDRSEQLALSFEAIDIAHAPVIGSPPAKLRDTIAEQ
jgi:hypothetical protein